MAISLVGALGAVSTGASGAAVTPAWGTGETRLTGNLLVLHVAATGSASLPPAPSGWSIAIQRAGTSCSASVFFRIALGGDGAPTVAALSGGTINARLSEYTGNDPSSGSVLGANGASSGTGSPQSATNYAVDAALGGLMVSALALIRSSAATLALNTATYNNATATYTSNAAVSTVSHYGFGYGTTTANAAADSDSEAFTATSITGAALGLAYFKAAPVLAPISSLVDKFDTLSGTWSPWGTTTSVVAGQLVMAPPVNSTSYTELNNATRYVLRGSSVYVQLVSAGPMSVGSWECFPLTLDNDTDNAEVQFYVNNGTISANLLGTGSVGSVPYVPATHAWLRIREASGTLYFETSPDATTWSTLYSIAVASLPSGFNVDRVAIKLSAGTYVAKTTAYTAVVDNLNSPPPTGVSLTRTAADSSTPSDSATRSSSRSRTAADTASPSDSAGGVLALPSLGSVAVGGAKRGRSGSG